MSACEKCWERSGGNPQRYHELVADNDCTPEEQARRDAKQCPRCKRIALHQYTGECMNPHCSSHDPNERNKHDSV
jgi:hypothetical protein